MRVGWGTLFRLFAYYPLHECVQLGQFGRYEKFVNENSKFRFGKYSCNDKYNYESGKKTSGGTANDAGNRRLRYKNNHIIKHTISTNHKW